MNYRENRRNPETMFRIAEKTSVRRQIEFIERRLCHHRVVTLSALDTSIERLLEILHLLEGSRSVRVLRLNTATITRPTEEGRVYIPRLFVDVTLNVDPRLTTIGNFTVLFKHFFLPGFKESNPAFEETDALDFTKEKEMVVPFAVVRKLRLPSAVGLNTIKEKKALLGRFEKAQKEKLAFARNSKRFERESVREVQNIYVDSETKPGFMNKYELLSWLTGVFREYMAIHAKKNVREILEEMVKESTERQQ